MKNDCALYSDDIHLSINSDMISGTRDCCMIKNKKYIGGELDVNGISGVLSPMQCQILCKNNAGCNEFTWQSTDGELCRWHLPTCDEHV